MGWLIPADDRLEIRLGRDAPLRLELWLTDTTVVLRLAIPSSARARVQVVKLDLGAAAEPALFALRWNMEADVVPANLPEWPESADRGREVELGVLLRDALVELSRSGASDTEEHAVRAFVNRAAKEALARADGAVLAALEHCYPSRRYLFYRWIKADQSGRLGQMAGAWPGLLAAAADLRSAHDGRENARRMLDDILAGRSLAEIAAPMIQRDVSLAFLKRASLALQPVTLTTLRTSDCALEDVPLEDDARVRWFNVMGSISDLSFDSRLLKFCSRPRTESPPKKRSLVPCAFPTRRLIWLRPQAWPFAACARRAICTTKASRCGTA